MHKSRHDIIEKIYVWKTYGERDSGSIHQMTAEGSE